MKITTKIFAFAVFAITTTTATLSIAQTMSGMDSNKGFHFGLGISGGIKKNDSPFKNMFGADLRLQADLSNYVSITGSGGYTKLVADDNGDDYNFIPVKGGVKVFPLTVKGFYGTGEAGAGFGLKDGAKTSFIWSAGIGYEWKNGFELGTRYEAYSQNSSSTTYAPYNGQFALRLGYAFKL